MTSQHSIRRYRSWPAALVLWAAFGVVAPSQAATPAVCTLKRYAALELVVDGDRAFRVPVMLKGVPGLMYVNLSSPFTRISAEAAKMAGLEPRAIAANADLNSGSLAITQHVPINDLMLGPTLRLSADLLIDPHTWPSNDPSGLPVFGSIGMDIVSGFDVELDVSHRVMNVYAHVDCPGTPVYWAEQYAAVPVSIGRVGDLYFPVTLAGKRIEATMGGGSQWSYLYTDVTRKLYGFDESSPDVEHATDKGGHDTAMFVAMALSTEDLQVMNARVQLLKPRQGWSCTLAFHGGVAAYDGCYGVHPLTLGQSVFAKIHLYLAPKRRMLYFTASEVGVAQDPVPSAPTP